MHHRKLLSSSILVGLTCSAIGLAACSSSDSDASPGNQSASDASADSSTNDASGDSSATDSNTDGTTADGTTADGTTADGTTADGTTADGTADAAVDSSSADALSDVGSTDAGAHSYALFVGSNYSDTAEVVAIDLDGPMTSRFTSSDQDTIVSANSGLGFALQRTVGLVTVLDPTKTNLEKMTLDVSPKGDGGKANPYASVVAAGDKAYVVRYSQNSLAIIDPVAGTIKGSVDLSAYVSDPDGLVDVFDGVVDPITKRAYFGLQRINQNVFGDAPDYAAACLDTNALIIAVDLNTDKVVDLNGSAAGEGIEVNSKNPGAIAWDETNKRILLLGTGCASAADKREGRGLEAIDPLSAKSTWLWQSSSLDRPAVMLWTGTTAIVGVDDSKFARHWYPWSGSATTLGSELSGIPSTPVYDGKGGLIGLETIPSDGGASTQVVRVDLSTKAKDVLRSETFQGKGLTATSSALIR